jgi:hypothetical protein
MLKLKSIDQVIRCPKCGKPINLDLSVEPTVDSIERAMGPEVECTWVIQVVCQACSHRRDAIIIQGYEYPASQLNMIMVEGDEWKALEGDIKIEVDGQPEEQPETVTLTLSRASVDRIIEALEYHYQCVDGDEHEINKAVVAEIEKAVGL